MYKKYFKRIIDFLLSSMALLILLPFLTVIGLLIRINLGSPIFFKQRRPGRNAKIFDILKFRTMTNEKDINGELLPNEIRLTKFGRWL